MSQTGRNRLPSLHPITRGLVPALMLALASPAVGQPSGGSLDETCVVSAFNRSAPVQPNGEWVLPSVPANIGRVRVRATCVADGVVRSGQSDFFDVPANGVIQVADIVFDAPAPIPTVLALGAPTSTLSTAGETVQLVATATFPDDSTADVSAAAAGTTYTISNPAIAEVDVNGLVTARASGTVLVTALHDGAVAFVRLGVQLGGDSDGDGIPDDFELANGLDPNDPADAFADPDADGLTNLEEFLAGLGLFEPDSDGDGLLDGDEVIQFGTDPLRFDTDGDFVSDGLEVLAGSDPLDPLSVDLGPILDAMTVDPDVFTLVFNTALGEASRQLTVTGTLIDGTVLDITGGPYGTTYRSDDLTIASFGGLPGQVFAGAGGATTITAANGARSATSQIAVISFSPRVRGFVRIPGAAHAVALTGDHALVAAGRSDLQVVDVSSPDAPTIVAALDFPGDAFDVVTRGSQAYVAAGNGGLAIIDIGSPAAPIHVASAPTLGTAVDAAIYEHATGRHVLIADQLGLRVFDVALPSAPVLVAELSLPGSARGVDISGDLAVVALQEAGVAVVDIADPTLPTVLGTSATRATGSASAADVTVRDRLAYVADGATGLGGVAVIDFTIPDNPALVGVSNGRVGLNDVALEGALLFGADYFFANAIPFFGLGGTAPVFQEFLSFAGSPSRRDDNGHGIAVRNGFLYLAGNRCCTRGFPTTGDSALHIGQYALLEDSLGQPPTVTITNPGDGASLRERRTLTILADANDDLLVGSVTFLADGEVLATDFSRPYRTTFTAPEGPASVVLEAVASDLGDNQGRSEPITLTILADASPAVRLLEPTDGIDLVEDSQIRVKVEATDDIAISSVALALDGATVGTDVSRPYQFNLTVPTGVASFVLTATATDNVGQQTVSEGVTVFVTPDEPPFVAVLVPSADGEVVEGAALRLEAGADDDFGVTEVQFLIDGLPVAFDSQAPYLQPYRVPTTPGVTIRVGARAIDTRTQVGTAQEITLTVVPDPGTTVVGRVVDGLGQPATGAEVDCLGVAGTSGADGGFSIAGVPTAFSAVTCEARGAAADGRPIGGTSGAVPPTVGGTTDVGEIRLAPQLLYGSLGNLEGFSDGADLVLVDEDEGRVVPWSDPIDSNAFSGLAFDATGTLYAATFGEGGGIASLGTPAKIGFPVGFGSALLRLDPDTGVVVDEIGIIQGAGGGDGRPGELSIVDMVYDQLGDRLLALEMSDFGFGTVLAVDPATAAATPVTDLQYESAAIAWGPGGLLYVLGIEPRDGGDGDGDFLIDGPDAKRGQRNVGEPGALFLAILDPLDGTLLDGLQVTGDAQIVGGMAQRPGTDTFVVATEAGLLELPLATLTLAPASVEIPVDLPALAFRPLDTATVVTTVTGRVIDTDGLPAAGITVFTLGGAAVTDAAGDFALVDLEVRTEQVRVAVDDLGRLVRSPATLPVPGGITDVETLTVTAPVCVQGVLAYQGSCRFGAPTEPFDLFLLGPNEDLIPAGSVVPGVGGTFCASVPPGVDLILIQSVTCDCGTAIQARCQAFTFAPDTALPGRCTDADPSCTQAGTINVFCDDSCPLP